MEKKRSKEESKSSTSKHKKRQKKSSVTVVKKKERGIMPYILNPLIYVLISLIIVLPIFIGFTNYSIMAVHNIQEDYVIDYSDIKVNTTRYDNRTLVYENDKIGVCEKVGVLKCEEVGIITDVYYGVNRVSMKNGAGLSSKSTFDSFKSKLNIAGYSTSAFKGVNNLSEGDRIIFETTDKIYEYTVESNTISGNPSSSYSSGLVLSCDDEEKAFSAFSNEKRYVVATFTSMRDRKGA